VGGFARALAALVASVDGLVRLARIVWVSGATLSGAMLWAATLGGCASPDPLAAWADQPLAEDARRFHAGAAPNPRGRAEALVDRRGANASTASSSRRAGLAGPTGGDRATPRASPDLSATVPQDAGVGWCVRQALGGNSQLRAARQRIERMRERIPQAGSLEDPIASVTFGELAETAAGQVDYIVSVRQSLPWPGELDARRRVARHEVTEALEAYASASRRVAAQVRRTFWSHAGARRERGVLDQSRSLLEQIRAAVEGRVRVGEASQGDLLRVSRRIASLENRSDELSQLQRTSAAALNRLMGRPAGSAIPWPAFNPRREPRGAPRPEPRRDPPLDPRNAPRLEPPNDPPTRQADAPAGRAPRQHADARENRTSPPSDRRRDEPTRLLTRRFDRSRLLRAAQRSHPQVHLAQAKAQTARARLGLTREARKPGFTLGVQYGAVGTDGLSPVADGRDQVAGAVGVSLPIWRARDDAAEAEAWRELGEALAEIRAARDRAVFEVDDALSRIRTHRRIFRRLRDRMTPDARQTIDVALAAYRTGDLNLLQLLDDWSALLEDQTQQVRTTAALQQAAADLRRVVGAEAWSRMSRESGDGDGDGVGSARAGPR